MFSRNSGKAGFDRACLAANQTVLFRYSVARTGRMPVLPVLFSSSPVARAFQSPAIGVHSCSSVVHEPVQSVQNSSVERRRPASLMYRVGARSYRAGSEDRLGKRAETTKAHEWTPIKARWPVSCFIWLRPAPGLFVAVPPLRCDPLVAQDPVVVGFVRFVDQVGAIGEAEEGEFAHGRPGVEVAHVGRQAN